MAINLDNALIVLETMCRDEWAQNPHMRVMVKDDLTAPRNLGVMAGDVAQRLGNRRAHGKVRRHLMELQIKGKVTAWGLFFWPRGLYQELK